MTPADLQIPERESVPVVEDHAEDPAIVAGKEAQEAAAAFNAIADTEDEHGPKYDAAQERTSKADDIFADAPVTSAAGALAKLEELREQLFPARHDPNETSLDTRHFKTVMAFLEAVVGGEAPAIDNHPDAELLARVAEFYPALEKHNITNEAWHSRYGEAEAMPDCPPHAGPPVFDRAGHDRWHAFMKAKGVWKLADKANAANRALGKAANRVFATPARTYPGAAEKVKIAYLATGDGEGTCTGDGDLSAYQDDENPWMKNAIADLERVAGVTEPDPDPVVTLFAKWAIIRDEATALGDADPKATDDEINKRWEDALRRLDAKEDQIMATPATSMRGVAIKIRIASHYIIEAGDVDKRYATPSRDIDYDEANGGPLGADGSYTILALLDAERLAGVS